MRTTHWIRWLAALTLVLGACGGGRDANEAGRSSRLELPATARLSAAACDRTPADSGLVTHRRVGEECLRSFRGFDTALAEGESRRTALAAAAVQPPALTVTELLDWAERTYPQYFPPRQNNRSSAPYIYRYYPSTQNYVGVAGNEVYILGPVSGGPLAYVGTMASFACLVHPTQCDPPPPKPCAAVASWTVGSQVCTPNADQTGQVASGTTVSYLDSAGATRGSASYTCTDGVMAPKGNPQCEPAAPLACNTVGLTWNVAGNTCVANAGEPTQLDSGTSHTFQASANTVGRASYACNDGALTVTAVPTCEPPPPFFCRPTSPLTWTVQDLTCTADSVPEQVALGGVFTVNDTQGQPSGASAYRCTSTGLVMADIPVCLNVPRIQDSFGGDGGPADGGASGDGTAGDGAPIVGGLVQVRDRFGREVTATTNNIGYYRVKLTGFVPPLLITVTRRDGVVRRSVSTQPLKINGYIFMAVTGLTDKVASDVARALGFAGAASLTPQMVQDNPGTVTQMVNALRNDSVVRPILVNMGIAPDSFDPFSTPFRADGTGYDGVLDRLQITTDSSGATVVKSLDCDAPRSWTVSGVTCTPDSGEETVVPNNQTIVHRDSVGPTTGTVGWTCQAGVIQSPVLPSCKVGGTPASSPQR
jgi:hypothetical protein